MKKGDLIAAISGQMGDKYSKTAVDAFLEAFGAVIREELVFDKNEAARITIPGVGTFSTAKRKGRIGTHPATGAEIEIKAKKVVKFKPAKQLIDYMNA